MTTVLNNGPKMRHVLTSPAQLPQLLEFIAASDELVLDLETTGLSPRLDLITDIGVGNGEAVYALCVRSYENGALLEHFSNPAIRSVFEALAGKRLITHNGSFDTRFAHHQYGVTLWPYIYADTIIAAHTTDENKFNYGLKVLATEVLGHDNQDQADMLASIKANGGSPKEYYKADSALRAAYLLGDLEKTWNLWKHYEAELDAQGLLSFFHTEPMELYRTVTVEMEARGVPVDQELLKRSKLEITAELEKIEDSIQAQIAPLLDLFHAWYRERHFPFKFSGEFKAKLAAHIAPAWWPRTKAGGYSFSEVEISKAAKKAAATPLDCALYRMHVGSERVPPALIRKIQLELLKDSGVKYPFNILSKDHLKRLFFTKLKEKALSHTDKGNPQVDDEFLDLMAKKYSWCAELRTYNRLTKIKGTYIDRILEEQENGIFYPSFLQHKTVSGRFGSDLQQLPRPIEEGSEASSIVEVNNRIRKFFVAGEHFIFVDDDYESLEPHIFAHVSGDDGLRNIFRNGHDFYSTIAIATEGLVGVSADKSAPNYLGKVNKAARQKAKAYCLGIPYGMGAYKLAFELEVSQQEAERLVKNYLDAYPALKSWMDSSKQKAVEQGFITTETGRVRRFPGLVEAYKLHGEVLFDQLEMWKQYHETPRTYAEMKELGGRCRNYVNNARNVQIQGLGASIVNKACIAIAKALKVFDGAYICAQIHDQIIVRCKEEHAVAVCELVQYHMENCYQLSLQLKAPPSTGKNFGESKG